MFLQITYENTYDDGRLKVDLSIDQKTAECHGQPPKDDKKTLGYNCLQVVFRNALFSEKGTFMKSTTLFSEKRSALHHANLWALGLSPSIGLSFERPISSQVFRKNIEVVFLKHHVVSHVNFKLLEFVTRYKCIQMHLLQMTFSYFVYMLHAFVSLLHMCAFLILRSHILWIWQMCWKIKYFSVIVFLVCIISLGMLSKQVYKTYKLKRVCLFIINYFNYLDRRCLFSKRSVGNLAGKSKKPKPLNHGAPIFSHVLTISIKHKVPITIIMHSTAINCQQIYSHIFSCCCQRKNSWLHFSGQNSNVK